MRGLSVADGDGAQDVVTLADTPGTGGQVALTDLTGADGVLGLLVAQPQQRTLLVPSVARPAADDASVDLGATVVGRRSADVVVPVRNAGFAPGAISTELRGTGSPFTVVDGCDTVGSGEPCAVRVALSPTAAGVVPGTLRLQAANRSSTSRCAARASRPTPDPGAMPASAGPQAA